MAITNRYFILPYPNVNSGIWDLIIETPETLRTNLAGTFCVVKLPVGDTDNHQLLNGFPEYTRAEILVEMAKDTWSEDIV